MRHRFLAIITGLVMVLSLSGTVLGSSGGGGGNCDSIVPDHWDQGKWAQPGGSTFSGIQADIDPADNGGNTECTNPTTHNDGVNFSVQVAEDACSGNQCASISIGAINCDNPLLSWVKPSGGSGSGCVRNQWRFFVWVVGEDGTDTRFDLGTSYTATDGHTVLSPSSNHNYEALFHTGVGGRWDLYIDDHFIFAINVGDANYNELNKDLGQKVEGLYNSERWDAGDALSYTYMDTNHASDYTNFRSMSFRGSGSNWYLPYSTSCNYDSEPTTHPHQEYCYSPSGYSEMDVYSIY